MNTLILLTEIAEKIILLLLLGLSIWSIAIMIDRRKIMKKHSNINNLDQLRMSLHAQDLKATKGWSESHSPFIGGSMAKAIIAGNSFELVDRAVAAFVREQKLELEKGLTVLATLGANAPFIGLFGTVLGIIRAFAYLGSQSGSASVMSGVSQALYATAIGLLVAIPAVIAFNVFSKKIRDLVTIVESLRDEYLSKVKR